MTKDQAIQILDNYLAQMALTRAQHDQIFAALRVLKQDNSIKDGEKK